MNRLLTDFELMILVAVLRLDEAYAVSISREIEATAGRTVVLGAVYAALDRLEAHGLVRSRIGDPKPERGGRARRYFRLTPRGIRAVKQTQRAFMALWANVPELEGGAA